MKSSELHSIPLNSQYINKSLKLYLFIVLNLFRLQKEMTGNARGVDFHFLIDVTTSFSK